VLGGSHFFLRTVGSGFWGQVLRTALIVKFFFLILRTALVFTSSEKIWLDDFQGWFSQVDSHKSWFLVLYV